MSALGDVIQALPVISSLQATFPSARIHWLVEEMAAPIVRLHPGVDRVLVSHRRRWGEDWRHPKRWIKVMGEVWGMVRGLRRPYDLAIDLQGLFKSGIWIYLSGSSRKVGFTETREWSHLFLTEQIPAVDRDLHAVERYLYLIKAIGGDETTVDFGISPPPGAHRQLRNVLQLAGGDGEAPYAVIIPTARWDSKQWIEAHYAELADRLVEDLDLQVAITGVHADLPLVDRIRHRMKQPAMALAGKTDLYLLMALLQGARIVISVDSGPMHLAAALGTPVVALFGPTAPWRTGPFGRGHRVIRFPLSCSPCFRRRCAHKTCMAWIRPTEVLDAVVEVVNQDVEGKTDDTGSIVYDKENIILQGG